MTNTPTTAADETDEARRVERAIEHVTQDHDEVLEPDPHPDRRRMFNSLGLQRMRTRWSRGEAEIVDMALERAEEEITQLFGDVYRILNRLYEVVREPLVNKETGEIVKDKGGYAVWLPDEFGTPVEDWSRLTERDKESFLHQITTRLVLWEQQAADLKGHALFAKAAWEERFAMSFVTAPQVNDKRPTEADRREHAQWQARDQRYLAIYMTVRSNKAEALVRSMERLSQRLKDTSR